MTALAFAGIALFAVALFVVAIGTARQGVRYVRDVQRLVSAGTPAKDDGTMLEDVPDRGKPEPPPADARPSEPDGDVPPGWGFR